MAKRQQTWARAARKRKAKQKLKAKVRQLKQEAAEESQAGATEPAAATPSGNAKDEA